MAAPTVTVLTQDKVNSPGATVTTASVSPSAGKLYVLVIAHRSFNSNAFFPNSVTGCGMTWTAKLGQFITHASSAGRIMVYTATGDAPTSGAITITHGVSIQCSEWALLEFTDAYAAGISGGKAVNQVVSTEGTGTGASISMGTFKNADSGTLGIFGLFSNQNITPDSNFTEIAEQTGTTQPFSLEVAYEAANDNSIDPSWTTSSQWGGIGLEIMRAPPLTNDNFANAIALSTTLPGSRTFDTTWNATNEVGEPNGGVDYQSVWYTFTPTADNYYRFLFSNIFWNGDTTFNFGSLAVEIRNTTTLADFDSSNFDNILFAAGSNASGSSAGNNIEAVMFLEAGTTYTIRVYSSVSSGNFNGITCIYDMAWNTYALTPPANDMWADAEVLSTTVPGSTSGTTKDATTEEGESYSSAQSVWYKFTPSVSGSYSFKIPGASLVGQGTSGEYAQVNLWDATGWTTLVDLDFSDQINNMSADTDFPDQDALMVEVLTAGTPYYIQVYSPLDLSSGGFNHRVLDFDLEWDFFPAPANDDFADFILISGASGSQDFNTAASTFETAGGEPLSYYWNDPQTQGTVWLKWVCPTTGDYKFEVQTLEDPGSTNVTYDLAIWTGTALNALTTVVRNWAGEETLLTTQKGAGTAVGFHGVSGTTYWIQIANWNPVPGDSTRLTWGSNTITGNTGATAANFLVGRIHNHGNDETDPPPNFATRLGAHSEWWFANGQIGKCKWYKYVAPADKTVGISGVQWNGYPNTGFGRAHNDIGLLAYKGASFGSLTNATSTVAQGSRDAAMMLDSNVFAESQSWFAILKTTAGNIVHLQVPVLSGETLWVCVFGMYDADIAGSAPSDASEFEIDIVLGDPPPANNNLGSFTALTPSNTQVHAYSVAGTTTNCDAEAGEPAHGGFGPARSVWYQFRTPWQGGDFRIWVESAGDCVLSVYNDESGFTTPIFGTLDSIGEDDDSGTGNWPEVTVNDLPGNRKFYIAVDSKAETDFVLKYQRLSTGTPPANDNFASAEAHTGAFTAVGTTVGATGEPDEKYVSNYEGVGATDGVWYKYTADHTGTLRIRGRCLSDNFDGYVFVHVFQGSSLANLTLVSSDSPPGEFFFGSTEYQNDQYTVNVVNGQDYYIRVATWSGGSEDFEIYVDTQQVYVDLQASGPDEMHGTLIDSTEVYFNLTASGVDVYHLAVISDAATIYANLAATSTEFKAHDAIDAATIYVDMVAITEHECIFHFEPSWHADGIRKWQWNGSSRRWALGDTSRRWAWVEGEGQPQIC